MTENRLINYKLDGEKLPLDITYEIFFEDSIKVVIYAPLHINKETKLGHSWVLGYPMVKLMGEVERVIYNRYVNLKWLTNGV